ncbi:MAG TPA: hypothetical protein P5317_10765 [Myxococcota bacterium]|nr:hypothetical protein [Myxococcota bacterium]HRR74841.1 hypothetical protein [Myxococcota bacterium]HRV18475.1 hypothetical protein [Myxococcota bacterium]
MANNTPALPTENFRMALASIDQYPPKDQVIILLKSAVEIMENMKTLERTQQDRHIAVGITDLEKITSWWLAMIAKKLL